MLPTNVRKTLDSGGGGYRVAATSGDSMVQNAADLLGRRFRPVGGGLRLFAGLVMALAMLMSNAGPAVGQQPPITLKPPKPLPEPTPKLVLWQGFHHRWEYNHRINRLGDYIRDVAACTTGRETCRPTLGHSAASGTGPDIAHFTTYYAKLESPRVKFLTGEQTIQINGAERENISTNTLVSVAVPPGTPTGPNQRYVVVLNGFDLLAKADADKLQLFDLRVTDGDYDGNTNRINFRILFSLQANCGRVSRPGVDTHLGDGVECEGSDEEVHYQLTVYFAIIAGTSQDLKVTLASYEKTYKWNKEEEIFLQSERHTLLPDRRADEPAFPPAAVMAIKRLRVELDRDHHLLEWDGAIRAKGYDRSTGEYSFDLDRLFKNWTDGMAGTHPPLSVGAYRLFGSARLTQEMALVQLSDACVKEGLERQGFFSAATGDAAGGPQAKSEQGIDGTCSFSLSPVPNNLRLVQGGTGTVTVGVNRASDFPASVSLMLVSPVSGITGNFSPASTTGTSSLLTLVMAESVPVGNHTVTVQGTGGNRTQTATLMLVVTRFVLSLSAPSVALSPAPGAPPTRVTVTIARSPGFVEDVALTLEGIPSGAGIGHSVSPISTTGNTSTSTLSLNAGRSAAAGDYLLTVHGVSSSGLVETVPLAVEVLPSEFPP